MVGPGDYVADKTEGVVRVEDLPPPRIEQRSREFRRRRCPFCGRRARRCGTAHRVLHDLGDARSGRPVDIHLTYSTHQCSCCRRCFNADMDDLALPNCHYTLSLPKTPSAMIRGRTGRERERLGPAGGARGGSFRALASPDATRFWPGRRASAGHQGSGDSG
jgi:hypothetical protein